MLQIRLLCIFLCLLLSSVNMIPASSQEKEEALLLFEEGIRLFQEGSFDKASKAFRQAHKLKPNWKLLYNIGQSEAAAKRYGLALEAFQQYLVLGGDEISSSRRDEVTLEINRFKTITGSILIEAEAGLTIFIDDIEYGETPLSGAILVNAGIEHSISAIKNGAVVHSKNVKVNSGAEYTVTVPSTKKTAIESSDSSIDSSKPVAETPTVTIPQETKSPIEEKNSASKLTVAGWTVTAIGAASLIACAATGGIALSLDKKLESDCSENGCPPSRVKDNDRMQNLALATDIVIGVGATAVVGGVIMLIISRTDKKEKVSNVSFVPTFAHSYSGVMFKKEF